MAKYGLYPYRYNAYYHALSICCAILFFTLLVRGTINAVTVICCRQAGRQVGPDWSGTLLIYIYGQNNFFPKLPPFVGGVSKF